MRDPASQPSCSGLAKGPHPHLTRPRGCAYSRNIAPARTSARKSKLLCFFGLVRAEGIEPSACPLSEGCSTTELSAHYFTILPARLTLRLMCQYHPPELSALRIFVGGLSPDVGKMVAKRGRMCYLFQRGKCKAVKQPTRSGKCRKTKSKEAQRLRRARDGLIKPGKSFASVSGRKMPNALLIDSLNLEASLLM